MLISLQYNSTRTCIRKQILTHFIFLISSSDALLSCFSCATFIPDLELEEVLVIKNINLRLQRLTLAILLKIKVIKVYRKMVRYSLPNAFKR